MIRGTCAAVLVLCLAAGISALQQPRDNARPAAVGTATVRGRVVSNDDEGRPLRRAKVTLSGRELEISKTVITADDGRFEFDRLPAGQFLLRAAKDGFVTMNAGAKRPGRPGTSVALRADETKQIELALPRGAVMTGRILTPEGDPAAGLLVSAATYRYLAMEGQRRLLQSSNSATTDDRGVYRIHGLPPGEYVVMANPRVPLFELQTISPSEVRAALAEVRRATAAASRPGIPIPEAPKAAAPVEPRRSVLMTPVLFPGTTMPERATTIPLHPGEVRSGVDFDLQYVPTATVEGFVSVPVGAGRVQVTLVNADRSAMEPRNASAGEDGRFMFRSLPPGDYLLSARIVTGPAIAGGYWGSTQVHVNGDDIAGVTISMQPGLTISGRIVLEGSQRPAFPAMRFPLQGANLENGTLLMLPNVAIEGDRFTIPAVVPGIYRITTPPRGMRTPIGAWWLKSIAVVGRELLDAELNLRESMDDLIATFSDRAGELSGIVATADGSPISDHYVVIFPRDERMWFYQSRRIAGLRPTAGGRYAVRNLPAGEYLIALTPDIEMNEWYDPAVLRGLLEEATPIRLDADEIRRLDLRR